MQLWAADSVKMEESVYFCGKNRLAMKVVVFDDKEIWENLHPITLTRPSGAVRVGVDTIAEKWQALMPGSYAWGVAEDYLAERFPCHDAVDDDTLFVAGHVLPSPELVAEVLALEPHRGITDTSGRLVARRGTVAERTVPAASTIRAVEHLYDIFGKNGEQLCADIARITGGRVSQPLSPTNTIIGDPSQVFIEEGAVVEGAFINTRKGPVYVGRDAEVMEGSMLRGPIALCEHAVVNMGSKIYPDTTIGPFCKVGGEVNNVVFMAYSNKAHDGFLGNAVIGQWCNIGAGAVASNLKNDYTPIRLWNYPTHRFLRTSLQFCGLIMGDHSKAGINTMFNTATVLGVGVNVHGSGFPRNFVESFHEGSVAGFSPVSLDKFFDIARRMMARRGRDLTPAEERLYTHLYSQV